MREIEAETATVENRARADLETLIDLAALLELTRGIAEELRTGSTISAADLELQGGTAPAPASSPGGDAAALAADELAALSSRSARALDAWRRTRPARVVGEVLGRLDAIAASEEQLSARLGRTGAWNVGESSFHLRSQREIARALALAAARLRSFASDEDNAASLRAGELEGPERELHAALESARAVEETLRVLERGEVAGDDAAATSAAAARLATDATVAADATIARVDALILLLEKVRAGLLASSEASRWLRSWRGPLSRRIELLAERETAHAARVEALTSEPTADAADASTELLVAHEDIRRATLSLATTARRESDAGAHNGVDPLRVNTLQRAATRLAQLASGELLAASRALAAAEESSSEQARALYGEALRLEKASAAAFERLSQSLAELERDAALAAAERLGDAAAQLERESDSASAKLRTSAEIATEARDLLARCEAAAGELAANGGAASPLAPVVERLALAARRLREAVSLALSAKPLDAGRALDAGREHIREAAAMARRLRGERASEMANAHDELEGETETDGSDEPEDAAGEIAARVATMLAELADATARQRQLDEMFEELLGRGADRDEARESELTEAEERLIDALEKAFPSAEEIAAAVARFLAMEEELTAIIREEQQIGAAAEEVAPVAATAGAKTGETGENEALAPARQQELTARGRAVADEFTKVGFRLASALPTLLPSYLRTATTAQEAVAAQERAHEALVALATAAPRGPAPAREAAGRARAAAERLDAFLAALRSTRQLALQAIVEEESGLGARASGSRGVRQSSSRMREALERLRRGDVKGARAAHRMAMRSLAEATRAVRAGANLDMLVPGSPGGGIGQDGGAGETWSVLTRGNPDALELEFRARAGLLELPYPAAYRDQVPPYLKAIDEGGR